jgi:hypothetical protein
MFLLCSAGPVEAQKLIFLFGHLAYEVPLDSYFKNNYNYGLGVEGGLAIGSGSTFFVGTVGYSSFMQQAESKKGNYSYVPLKGGLRKYLLVGKFLFVQVDAGVAVVKNDQVNSSRFSADLGLGAKLGPFEVMADYDGFANGSGEPAGYSSWIGVKAGMRLGL